jgi:sugar phosphate isomerase/epimerase
MSKLKQLLTAGVIVTVAALPWTMVAADKSDIKLGLQSYTCRNMDFEQIVDFAVRHHIQYLQMYSKHMDPFAPVEETLRKKAVLEKHGLVCYTFGVNSTSLDKEKNRKLFEFAKAMGIKMIVVEPKDMAEWDNLEALVKEYDIKLCIHNHGLTSTYGNPETVKKVLKARDPRIGVCLDVGHLTAAGFDAATTFRGYEGRVFDIHLKDKKKAVVDGKPHEFDVVNGTGDANYKDLFTELSKSHWKGVLAIETDNSEFAKAPDEYVAASAKFVRENVR